ncbi:hypothetical protein H6G76_25790 [Nostoc sp. FACHB-152]|uniref:TrbI/VirB10 family protein n=1 Tax=Nostoc sp. FACHB-152 TaxID=2692837 RepID=UPI00168799A4|nr:TrbI/VirB10 family protein [Nostoc sp. FACHB-152]MBD2450503.1 hypothetical protein [Nostoc sp. FACHB-152]
MSEVHPNNYNGSLSGIDNLLAIDDDTANNSLPHQDSQTQIQPESLLLTKHTLVTSPWSRLLIISVPFGFGFLAIFFLLNGVFHPQQDKTAQQPQQQSQLTEQAQVQDDNDGDARAKLALSDQADELGKMNHPDQDTQSLPSTPPQKVVSTPTVPQTTPYPSPRPTYRPSPRTVEQPTPAIKVNSTPKPSRTYSSFQPATVTRPLTPVDPTAEFNRLRTIGSYGVIAYASTENTDVNTNLPVSTLDPLDPAGSNGANSNLQQPGDSTPHLNADISNPTPVVTTDGIEQIRPRWQVWDKNYKPDKYLAQENLILNEQLLRYLTVGEEASGVLVTPVIKQQTHTNHTQQQTEDGKRFVARLTQDLHDNYGDVAIPVRSLLAVELVSVDAGNYAIASVKSIIKDNTEYPIPDGAISVHGKAGQPLIAQKFHSLGGEIAQYDMTVGLVGGLAKVGEIINQPDVQQSIQTAFGGGYSNTTVQNNRRNLGAAFLEGAFGKLGDIVSERAARSTQEILSRPNVWYIPQGTKVSFIVNRTLELP